nr:hypothetical protein [Capnocytophaga canis]
MGKKKNKKWFIYAYSDETKEIVSWVWGQTKHKNSPKTS